MRRQTFALTGCFLAGLLPMLTAAQDQLHVEAMVDARRSWQVSGLVVKGPGRLSFRATGEWTFNPAFPSVDADGASQFSTEGRAPYAYSGRGGREGQLIGKIGEGRPFIVGTSGSYEAGPGESGMLHLVINDDIKSRAGAGLNDNNGWLTVKIEFSPRL